MLPNFSGTRVVTAFLNSVIFLEQEFFTCTKGFSTYKRTRWGFSIIKLQQKSPKRGADNYRQQIAANNKRQKNGVGGKEIRDWS